MKNKKLEEENNKLKDELNKIKYNESNEIKQLKLDIDKYKNELIKANKIISNLSNNQVNNNELKKLKDEITNLKLKLSLKDDEIRQLKNNNIPEQKVNYQEKEKEKAQSSPNDLFAEVE